MPRLSQVALVSAFALATLSETVLAAPITSDIFKDKGCVQCHKVSAYGVEGGETGPDLSLAYTDVKDRFGMSLDKFLKAPTGTMQMVFGSMIKLTPEEKTGIYKLLKEAHEKNAKK